MSLLGISCFVCPVKLMVYEEHFLVSDRAQKWLTQVTAVIDQLDLKAHCVFGELVFTLPRLQKRQSHDVNAG